MKRSSTVHWVTYDGVNRVACGKRQTVGGEVLRITADHTKATCKTCMRIATGKPTAKRARQLNPGPPSTYAQLATMRLQYAGAIGLLCELSTRLARTAERADDLDSIELAVADFCRLTGWTYRRVVHRIEVFPPATTVGS